MGVSFICLLPSTLGPALPMRARQRSSRPGQLFGLCVGERGATTLAIQRSLSGARTTGQSVCRALTADFTATRNIQGAFATILFFEIFLVNFSELCHCEVLRISLPGTSVNKGSSLLCGTH